MSFEVHFLSFGGCVGGITQSVLLHSQTYLHSTVSPLETGLAAAVIIVLWGKKRSGLFAILYSTYNCHWAELSPGCSDRAPARTNICTLGGEHHH